MIWSTKTVVALLLLCCLSLYAAYDGYSDASRYKGEATESARLLVQAQARTALIQKQVQKATASADAARAQLKEVLDASPEVRDAATPEPVRVSLCATLRCK